MTTITQIDLYMALRGKIGDPEAKIIAGYIDQKIDTSFDTAKEHLATKQDIYVVREEVHLVREDLANVKSQLLMWMFGLFVPFYIGMIVFLIRQFL